jgi:hypothetical protein
MACPEGSGYVVTDQQDISRHDAAGYITLGFGISAKGTIIRFMRSAGADDAIIVLLDPKLDPKLDPARWNRRIMRIPDVQLNISNLRGHFQVCGKDMFLTVGGSDHVLHIDSDEMSRSPEVDAIQCPSLRRPRALAQSRNGRVLAVLGYYFSCLEVGRTPALVVFEKTPSTSGPWVAQKLAVLDPPALYMHLAFVEAETINKEGLQAPVALLLTTEDGEVDMVDLCAKTNTGWYKPWEVAEPLKRRPLLTTRLTSGLYALVEAGLGVDADTYRWTCRLLSHPRNNQWLLLVTASTDRYSLIGAIVLARLVHGQLSTEIVFRWSPDICKTLGIHSVADIAPLPDGDGFAVLGSKFVSIYHFSDTLLTVKTTDAFAMACNLSAIRCAWMQAVVVAKSARTRVVS